MAKIYFLTGGVRSGKSQYAENLAGTASCKVGYIATALVTDIEMEKRVSLHRGRRPKNWATFELSEGCIMEKEIETVFSRAYEADIEVIILDCITNLLFRLIYEFNESGILDSSDVMDNLLEERIERRCENFFKILCSNLLKAKRKFAISTILVSNEVGLGVVPPYPFGRIYRDMLGAANKKIAAIADEVLFFVSGLNIKLK
jgi:adenosylcobinamide kinase/adenosylcobinamide-phosphate guanylyltransferase